MARCHGTERFGSLLKEEKEEGQKGQEIWQEKEEINALLAPKLSSCVCVFYVCMCHLSKSDSKHIDHNRYILIV